MGAGDARRRAAAPRRPRASSPSPRHPPPSGSLRPLPPLLSRPKLDNGTYGTATRKFLTVVPLALFALATHAADAARQPLTLNSLVALVLVLAKLPMMHRVRLFGIGAA